VIAAEGSRLVGDRAHGPRTDHDLNPRRRIEAQVHARTLGVEVSPRAHSGSRGRRCPAGAPHRCPPKY